MWRNSCKTGFLLNGSEVAPALNQQANVGLQKVAVGDATDCYGKFAVNQSADAKSLGISPNQRQTGFGVEGLGEFLIIKLVMWYSPSE